jgi:multimeric flavodoxin WrbA
MEEVLAISLLFLLQQTREQWQTVFAIIAGFLTFGIVFFGIFGRGEIQDWAKEEEDEEGGKLGGGTAAEEEMNMLHKEDTAATNLHAIV